MRSDSDREILRCVDEAFAHEPRPHHFTNFTHCCECAEHDAVLRARDRDTLAIEDVGNAGWDPICFITAEGFRYYLPSLVRLALGDPGSRQPAPYVHQLLFHLIGDGEDNRRVAACTPPQRKAVTAFLWHLTGTRDCKAAGCEDNLERAIEIWTDDARSL